MSGLNPSSIDLAVSSKVQIAQVLKDLLPSAKFVLTAGSGLVETGKDVNPALGNNFEFAWDDTYEQVVIHNDFPVYPDASSQDYYYIDTVDPDTDKNVPLASLTAGMYNHLFLVNGAAHVGSIKIVPTATTAEPSASPDVKVVYIGWVYRGAADEIILHNIGRLIDPVFLLNPVTYIDFLDLNTAVKVSVQPTNLLRYTGFLGPGDEKTIREVALFIKDSESYPHMFAYSKIADTELYESESLRVLWEIKI